MHLNKIAKLYLDTIRGWLGRNDGQSYWVLFISVDPLSSLPSVVTNTIWISESQKIPGYGKWQHLGRGLFTDYVNNKVTWNFVYRNITQSYPLAMDTIRNKLNYLNHIRDNLVGDCLLSLHLPFHFNSIHWW